MRIRATVAAVSGALALSALAVPAAQADGSTSYSPADVKKSVEAVRQAASGNSTFAASDVTGTPYALDLSFSNVKVNSGKPIVVGTTAQVTVPVTYTVTHGEEVDLTSSDFYMDVEIYRGSYDDPSDLLWGEDWPVCTATSTTVATCKGTIDIYPDFGELTNDDATTWKVGGYAIDSGDQDLLSEDLDLNKVGYAQQDTLGTTKLQRKSKLTVNAAPEPVVKGKTITVTGKLSRANWETNKYAGYSTQSVILQFRKKGTTNYVNVKGIKSSTTGALKTTTKATVDGYYRFQFKGTSTTPAVTVAGDYVDVK